MKKALLALFILGTTSAYADVLTCTSYEDRDDLQLTVRTFQNGNIRVKGTSVSPGNDDWTADIKCEGTTRESNLGRANKYNYFTFAEEVTEECPWHFVRLAKRPGRNGKIALALVNRGRGGDDHWSGYEYDFYACEVTE